MAVVSANSLSLSIVQNMFRTILPTDAVLLYCCVLSINDDNDQALKYNFQGGGTVQLFGPPVRSRAPRSFPWPIFNSGLSNYQ